MVVLILPGINSSGPKHWQTYWEKAHPEFRRVDEQDWEHPVCAEWVATLEAAVKNSGPETVLVAHSLAVLQVAHWARQTRLKVQSAFLVAPPDPDQDEFPRSAVGFSPVPLKKLGFPSLLVSSTNDPYADLEFNQRCARAWESDLVNIGPKGHINADSGLKDWPEGFHLFQSLIKKGIHHA
jgi:uncharacterized protein